jgi:GntR family transcriptional regulator/MocR family aminotransferase
MLLNCLLENCSDSLIPQQSDAGMHILADLKHGIEDQTAHKALLAHGIDSLPLSVYCSEPIQRSALVLGFSGVPRKAMPRLTKKLGEKLRSLH